ncbi:MAG: YcgL domain-containing protein [Methylococcaceae bacterium]|nr:YcgL domain-containing protein [Methylococcaceae bacterium]
MQCFIYKSLKKDQLYLYVDKKDDFTRLPEGCMSTLGRLELVMELTLTPERTLAREEAEKVRHQLQTKGFFIQLPPTIVAEHPTIQ